MVIFKSAAILSIGIFIGRISGYLRELLIAYQYKTSHDADIVILILTLPDLLNNLLSAGVMGAVMIPKIYQHENQAPAILILFIKKTLFLSFLFLMISFIILFFMYDNKLFFCLGLSFLSIFPNTINASMSAYLQYKRKFLVQSFGTLVFNSTFILFLISTPNKFILSAGVVFSSFMRLGTVFYETVKSGFKIKSVQDKTVRPALGYSTIFTAIISNGILYISPSIDRLFSSLMAPGSVSTLSYAEKLYLLPVSVFLTTYAVALFPDISRMLTEKKKSEFIAVIRKSVVLNLLISAVVTLILFGFGKQIAFLLYGMVGLNDQAIMSISQVLNGFLIALFLAGSNAILLNVLYAFQNFREVIIYSTTMVAMKVILDWLVVYFKFGIYWIAFSTSVIMIISVVILSFFIYRNVKR